MSNTKPVYVHLASAFAMWVNSVNSDEYKFLEKAQDYENTLNTICREFMPSGSGFNSGTIFDIDKSQKNKLIFHTYFHHMNSDGMYLKWTDHNITVTPTFTGIEIKISGPNYNGIKEYMYEVFNDALSKQIYFEKQKDTYIEAA